MQLIDSHCHIDFEAFDHDRAQVLENCARLGITHLLVPGVKHATWDRLIALTKTYPQLYPALGLHPLFIAEHQIQGLEILEAKIQQHQPVAVGEIGLDYSVKDLDRSKQNLFFEKQLLIAEKFNLPVILHVRKAHDEVLVRLKKSHVRAGICHAFNGSKQQAEKYIELGFKLGFGGTLTYEHSRHIRQLAADLPLDSIVLETDAPDMVVASHRGERNSPEYILEVLRSLALLRNESLNQLKRKTSLNAFSIVDFVALT